MTPEIFEILQTIPRGAGNEYQLTDAINVLCQKKPVYAFKFEGERFDTGNIHGYLDATVDFALKDPETREKFIQSLQYRMKKYGITL